MIQQLSGPPIHGMRETASGLVVPTESARAREVWGRDEFKAIDKAAKVLNQHRVAVVLFCQQCKEPLKRVRRADGGITLRCAHLDREVHRL